MNKLDREAVRLLFKVGAGLFNHFISRSSKAGMDSASNDDFENSFIVNGEYKKRRQPENASNETCIIYGREYPCENITSL